MTTIIKTKYTLRRDLKTYCCKCGCEITPTDERAYVEPYDNTSKLCYKGVVVTEEIDDEGLYWRNLCKPCAEELSNVDATTIYNTYDESRYDDNEGYDGGCLPYFVN